MNIVTRTATAGAAAALVVVPTAVLVATPASADTEKHVACAGGHLELGVDREAGGWEIDSQLDDVAPGQRWRIVLKHDGNRYFAGVRTTDREGDLDVDRFRSDSSGRDTFAMTAVRVSDGTTCRASLTVG